MNLYFGDTVTTMSTFLVIGLLSAIFWTVRRRNRIEKWGRRVAGIGLYGLLVCVFVAMRDAYPLSVQAATDLTIQSGLFAAYSIQSTLGCIGGALIAFCCLTSIFIRKQNYRQSMFYIVSVTILLKTALIELSRVLL